MPYCEHYGEAYYLLQAKALALLQRKGGIQAAEPNAVRNKEKAVLPDFQSKVQKRLNSSNDDGKES